MESIPRIPLFEFYHNAKRYVIGHGFKEEIDIVEQRTVEQQDATSFFFEYVFVVLNSGMKNQIAEKIYKRFLEEGTIAIGHPGKRKAVEKALDGERYKRWWHHLKNVMTVSGKLNYLESLPWIGKITKYHLARNLGLDVAKPDRHLVRLADNFGYKDVQTMCEDIAERTGDRIGVVDVVLWRYMNLLG